MKAGQTWSRFQCGRGASLGATLTGRTEATLRPVCMEAEERKAGGGADRKAQEETADRRADPGVRLGTLGSQGGETQGLPLGF